MDILGIKPSLGWEHRFVNMWGNHDPAAVLLRDGEIVAAAEEERFTRRKRSQHTFPARSIEYVLAEGGMEVDDVDVVAIGRNPKRRLRHLRKHPKDLLPSSALDIVKLFEETKTIVGSHAGAHETTVAHRLEEQFGHEPEVAYESVSHHRCHAASAAYCADASAPVTVTIDNRGEHDSTVLWDPTLERVAEFSLKNSIGVLYAAGTKYLGYDHGSDAGKVMGLASYGEHREEFADAFDTLTSTGDLSYDVTTITAAEDPVAVLEAHFGPRKTDPTDFEQRHRDFAYHLQRRTEELVTNLVRDFVRGTGVQDVAMAGGVAMNCKLNREILNLECVDSLFVQPAANDSGIAIGAALEAHRRRTGVRPDLTYEHVYFGPGYENDEVETALRTAKLDFEQPKDVADRTADLLFEGKLVGWFQGRMEFGARALGHRSILANPTDERFRDQVNENVKHRETWRPFAPSILAEAREEYLVHGDEAPFMIVLDEIEADKREEIAAVTHVDGTTRPQTVTKENNPRYHRLIAAFAERSGVPVVLNTSFNVAGEPIVESPTQAIQDFYATGLDALVVGDYVLTK